MSHENLAPPPIAPCGSVCDPARPAQIRHTGVSKAADESDTSTPASKFIDGGAGVSSSASLALRISAAAQWCCSRSAPTATAGMHGGCLCLSRIGAGIRAAAQRSTCAFDLLFRDGRNAGSMGNHLPRTTQKLPTATRKK
jgi:hypothetical protein